MSLQIIEWPDFLRGAFTTGVDKSGGSSLGGSSPGAPPPCDSRPGNSATGVQPLSAMTIGVFDGLHLGHQALIKKITGRGLTPTVVTFRENPARVISPAAYKGDIFSLKQKLSHLEQMGVKSLILIDFSLEFSKLDGWEFLALLEERGKMAYLAIGCNFRCGYRQGTGAEYIAEMNKKRGIPTELLQPVVLQRGNTAIPVSSSGVRAAINAGDLKMAAALMGRNFELDLSDMEGQVYDIGSLCRIIPPSGEYAVLFRPGDERGLALIRDGKLTISGKHEYRVESLEFI